MVGEDLQRLAVPGDDLASDLAEALSRPVRRKDAQLALGKLFDHDRRPGNVASGLELLRDRDDVPAADTADLDDLHGISIACASDSTTLVVPATWRPCRGWRESLAIRP